MRERDIERILVDEVRRLGGRAYKWTSPGNAGVPDPDRNPTRADTHIRRAES